MAKKDSVQMLKDKICLLNFARKKIENRSEIFICYALQSSFWENSDTNVEALDKLRKYISKSLQGYSLLEHWLNGKQPHRSINSTKTEKYRLQWIDWMIQCLNEDLSEKLAKGK